MMFRSIKTTSDETKHFRIHSFDVLMFGVSVSRIIHATTLQCLFDTKTSQNKETLIIQLLHKIVKLIIVTWLKLLTVRNRFFQSFLRKQRT